MAYFRSLWCAGICVLLAVGVCKAQPPGSPSVHPSALASYAPSGAGFTDQDVERAIAAGIEHLWATQKADGSWGLYKKGYPVGCSALPVYALLASGVSAQDPRMEKALEFLGTHGTDRTYALGLRANVWEMANRQTRGKYRKLLKKDVALLITSTKDGSYNYGCKGNRESSGDHSNSQYGLLGVWAGAAGGLEIPSAYWEMVIKYWMSVQNADGGWQYRDRGNKTTRTMTAAGIASLYVCFDNLFVDKFVKCDADLEFKPITRGLDWMEENFEKTLKDGGRLYYYLYGVERVGLACGYKYFGKADWYKLGTQRLLSQRKDGEGWGSIKNTSFALLFLARGRHPVLVNKLEYDADWNNRPRDAANLTRWISRSFERPVNWQIINLDVPVSEWHDAPILYLSGTEDPDFSDDQLDKLRRYVGQGGTLLTVTECGGSGFRKGIRDVYRKLFPDYELRRCGPRHDIYSVYFKTHGRPVLWEVSNGVRPLAFHCDQDLPRDWQTNRYATGARSFEAAANMYLYVTDKGALRARGTSPWPVNVPDGASSRVTVARIAWSGNDDPEPLAYERFARMMALHADTQVNLIGPVPAGEIPDGAQLAVLTGTGKLTLNDDQKAALKAFVEGGGTLLVDPAGGDEAFADSARDLLNKQFGRLRPLAPSAEVYHLPGHQIDKVSYRRKTRVMLGGSRRPTLVAAEVDGRTAVFFSRVDLTAGLVGYPATTVQGYEPGSVLEPGSPFKIVRNITLYAAGKR